MNKNLYFQIKNYTINSSSKLILHFSNTLFHTFNFQFLIKHLKKLILNHLSCSAFDIFKTQMKTINFNLKK